MTGHEDRLGQAVPGWTGAVPMLPEPMTGRYVRVEPLSSADHARDLHGCFAGADALWDYLPYGPFPSTGAYAAWVDETVAQHSHLFFALRNLRTGRAEGVASYLRMDPGNGSIEVGNLCFSPAIAGTRAATEAMFLMMVRAFELGYRRYEWKCNALNRPSRRAAQRLGFSYEGVFRQATVVKGRNRDTAWFSIIDSEWPRLAVLYQSWLSEENFDDEGRQKTALSALTHTGLAQRDPIFEDDQGFF